MSELHICRGSNVRYQARVRRYGHRKYELVGTPHINSDRAVQDLMRKFWTTYEYKRGDVVMTADYYDPVAILEVRRP